MRVRKIMSKRTAARRKLSRSHYNSAKVGRRAWSGTLMLSDGQKLGQKLSQKLSTRLLTVFPGRRWCCFPLI